MRKQKKSSTAGLSAAAWAQQHFGGAELGDIRRENGLYGWLGR